ncbi:putative membrane protein [Vibrio cholerae HC-46B1]|nr:putative membrane protein [Vibrio cholerae HC-46B1]CPR29801.1 hypothetical protein [Vibrio cholerae]CPR29802.1 hypothetical protein [Vibrio cholerae]
MSSEDQYKTVYYDGSYSVLGVAITLSTSLAKLVLLYAQIHSGL